MHIEKNMFDNIFNTMMDIKGKIKGNMKANMDLFLYHDYENMKLVNDEIRVAKPKAIFLSICFKHS